VRRPPVVPASSNRCDVRVVQQRARLALLRDAREDLAALYAGLDELQRDTSP
jgi:hypothetical protein